MCKALPYNHPNAISERYIRAHTKKCPHCQVPIEHAGGCRYMKCTNCDYAFIWDYAYADNSAISQAVRNSEWL
jgi:tRNA(Ile2) C34 agmatinyltransferase TiaS